MDLHYHICSGVMMKNKYIIGMLTAIVLFLAVSCASGGGNSQDGENPGAPVTITVDTTVRHQYVRGFGGMSNAWSTPVITENDITTMYGENGLGYNIFRIMIYPDRERWSAIVPAARKAKSYGALILASPWTPPPELKSNKSPVGGNLPKSSFAAYAAHLRSFVDFMAQNGAKIDVISFQNEPDYNVSYDSCNWTSRDMMDFVINYGREIGDVLIIPGEPYQFSRAFHSPMLNSAEAVEKFDIIGGHIYGGGLSSYRSAAEKGKEVWMTEHLLNTPSDYYYDSTWPAAMTLAKEIHDCMNADFNAYIWWYLKRFYSMIGDDQYDTDAGQVLNRGYVMSHYAKYATGKYRVDAQRSGNSQVLATVYEGEDDLCVVMINMDTKSSDASILLPDQFERAGAVETAAQGAMLDKPVTLADGGGTARLRLAPRSVVSIRFEK
jgi:O-glycosyl hydrolase